MRAPNPAANPKSTSTGAPPSTVVAAHTYLVAVHAFADEQGVRLGGRRKRPRLALSAAPVDIGPAMREQRGQALGLRLGGRKVDAGPLVRTAEGGRFAKRRFNPFFRGNLQSDGKQYADPATPHTYAPWPPTL